MFRAVLFSTAFLCAQSGDWGRVQALPTEAQAEGKRFSDGPKRTTICKASK